MKLFQLFESVMSPVQKRVLTAVETALEQTGARISVPRADYDDWMTVKIDNETCAFRVKDKVLCLANMYLPEKLRNSGYMTKILKQIKADLGSALNGKCKVVVPMNIAGWEKIVERAGFEWVPPPSREEYLKHLTTA